MHTHTCTLTNLPGQHMQFWNTTCTAIYSSNLIWLYL
jgi:hypothetical protein